MFSLIRNHLLEISSAGYNAGNQFLDHKEMLSNLKVTQATSYLKNIVDQISSSSLGKTNSTESIMNKKEIIIERTHFGMDLLAAVSLYNCLGQETGIYILLVDLLQGLSIETIGTLVYNKFNEHEVQFSNTSTYTG
ncbi:unnamed protein product [Adineta steineri]|uniref:Uncharacterized protein n=1 Tax=Adineta steineri TaxID=433720 RepID=A0A814PCQ6_9BILA|nr:unnamed protein product [Adineta steineri]CAF4192837.1 unnamed protein product [Adineta steineri]